MILQREVRAKALEKGVSPEIIDKDWVLSHVLKGICEMPNLGEHLIFKGGTCLKKCFFPDYRFSEDLDFTATVDNLQIDIVLINELCQRIFEQSGIRMEIPKIKEQRFNDVMVGYEVKIKYWGANHPKNRRPPESQCWTTSIKIDTNWYEKMIFTPIEQSIIHDYSDFKKFEDFRIRTYSIEEVLSEKLRALIQRKYKAARDYFDIWTLNQRISDLDWEEIHLAFLDKCKYKNIVFTGVEQILNENIKSTLDKQWHSNLKNQLRAEDFHTLDVIYRDLELLFQEIF